MSDYWRADHAMRIRMAGGIGRTDQQVPHHARRSGGSRRRWRLLLGSLFGQFQQRKDNRLFPLVVDLFGLLFGESRLERIPPSISAPACVSGFIEHRHTKTSRG